MGRFVNPDSSAFQVPLNSRIYVDKTGLIEYTNSVLDTRNPFFDLLKIREYSVHRNPFLFCLVRFLFEHFNFTTKRKKIPFFDIF